VSVSRLAAIRQVMAVAAHATVRPGVATWSRGNGGDVSHPAAIRQVMADAAHVAGRSPVSCARGEVAAVLPGGPGVATWRGAMVVAAAWPRSGR